VRNLRYLFPCVCVVMVLAVGCEEDAPTTSSARALDQFPNAIGCRWTYETREYAGAQPDTVDVQVVSVGTSPEGEAARIWYATYRHQVDSTGLEVVDTMWAVEAGDTVKVYRSRPPRVMSFVLPFKVDNSWTTPGHGDTTTVSGSVSMISYPGGILSGGYLLDRVWSEDGVGYESSSIIVVPDVGIVVMDLNAVSLVRPVGTSMDSWRILSFDVQ